MPALGYEVGDTAKCEALYIEAEAIRQKWLGKHLAHFQLGTAKRQVVARIEQALRQKEVRLRSHG